LKVVGTSEELVMAKSLEEVLPTKRELKSKFVFSIVMKGYLPIALSGICPSSGPGSGFLKRP
jgi:hypothetical protein